MAIALVPFAQVHLELLKSWLRRPHVQRWYPDPDRDIDIATNQPPGGFHALISEDGRAIGYIRWQYVGRETLDELGLQQIPANSVDIDILIGEETQVAKGSGPTALQLLAERLLGDRSVPVIGLTTSVDNLRAQKAFAKAGFRTLLQYDPNGHGLCHLMIRNLEAERGHQ